MADKIEFCGVMTAYKNDPNVSDIYVTFFDGSKCYGDISIYDMSGQQLQPRCAGNPSLFYLNKKSFVAFKDRNSNAIKGVMFDGMIWSSADNLFADVTDTITIQNLLQQKKVYI